MTGKKEETEGTYDQKFRTFLTGLPSFANENSLQIMKWKMNNKEVKSTA